MNCWSILEIPQNSDMLTIKKAYVRLLKIYHPEDDAKGYQRLREAYDAAVKFKKAFKEKEIRNQSDNVLPNQEHINELVNKKDLGLNKESILDINIFMENLNKIYTNNTLRDDENAWKELLNKQIVWHMETLSIVNEKVFEFVLYNRYLKSEIWQFLDKHFRWSKNELQLYKQYDSNLIDKLLKAIKGKDGLSYRYLEPIPQQYLDEYLFLREKGYMLIKNENLDKAREYLFAAYTGYDNDPELLNLIGNYYRNIYEFDKAVEYFEKAILIDNMYLDAILTLGNTLCIFKKDYPAAIPYLEKYLAFRGKTYIAINNLTLCYYYVEDYNKAQNFVEKWLILKPEDTWAKKLLQNINLKLEGKEVKTIKAKRIRTRPKKTLVQKNIFSAILIYIAAMVILAYFIDKVY